MKLFSKALSLVLVLAMVLGMSVAAFAAEETTAVLTTATLANTIASNQKVFTDSASISNKESVAVLSTINVIDGYTNGSFGPTYTIKRGQATAFICRLLLGRTEADALAVSSTVSFSDVATDYTFAKYISYCVEEGIVNGYEDGTFKASNQLSTAAFTKMLLVALGYNGEKEGFTGENWKTNVQNIANELGLYANVKSGISAALTREEAAAMCLNALNAKTVTYSDDKAVQSEKTLAAEKYPALASAATVGALGRPSTTWTLNGEEIYSAAVAATSTLKGVVTTGALYTALNGATVSATYVDGEAVDAVVAEENGTATVAGTSASSVMEVYVADGKATVVIYNLYTVKAAAAYANGSVKATSTALGEIEITDSAVSSVKKDGYMYVAYDKALEQVVSASIATAKSGKASKASATSIKIAGTTYSYAADFENLSSTEAAKIEDDSTVSVVLDASNSIVAITAVVAPKKEWSSDWIFLAYYYGEYGNNKNVNGQIVKEYKCCAMNGKWQTIYAENDNILWYVGTFCNLKWDSTGTILVSADRCDGTTNDFLAFIVPGDYISYDNNTLKVNDTYNSSGHTTGEKSYKYSKDCKIYYFYGGYEDYFQEITFDQMDKYTSYYETKGGCYLYCTYDEDGLINNFFMYGY